jgi:hypothetical protein
MKANLILLAIVADCFFATPSNAEVKDAIITWTGNAGYHVHISMTYDDSFATVGAWGAPPSSVGTPTNQGISRLSVDFYSPSSQRPVFSFDDISNGTINYRFLSIDFDTSSRTLFGSLDVGKDSFAEEELPGSSAGQYYLHGVSFPILVDSYLAQSVDSGGQFVVTVIPEPSTWCLCVAGLAVIIVFRITNRSDRCAALNRHCAPQPTSQ